MHRMGDRTSSTFLEPIGEGSARPTAAGVSLAAISLVAGALALCACSPEKTSAAPKAAPTIAAAPTSAATPAKPDDLPIVHVDPNAPVKPPSAAARRDAEQARLEMPDRLRQVDAAVLVLTRGYQTRNQDDLRDVSMSMQRLYAQLTARHPGINGEAWPEAADEGFEACSDAVSSLEMLASGPLDTETVESVTERQQNFDTFKEKQQACHAWVDPRKPVRHALAHAEN